MGRTARSVQDLSTATLTEVPVRLDVDAHLPMFSKALTHLDHATTKECDRAGLDHRLRELLRLRVSQLNGCAYCVDMHAQPSVPSARTSNGWTRYRCGGRQPSSVGPNVPLLPSPRRWCGWPTTSPRR